MGALGNFIEKTAGSSKSNIEDFLSTFGAAEQPYVSTIDPQTLFDVKFEFFPHVDGKSQNKDKKNALQKLGKAVEGAVKSALNNATGGLLSTLKLQKVKINKLHKEYANVGKFSFMNYLAPANLLVMTKSGAAEKNALILDLGLYVQSMTIPKMQTYGGQAIEQEYFGKIMTVGSCVIPDNNTFTMAVLNTKVPLIERIFYPWMREVTLPYWSYPEQPYTTAKVTVNFKPHADFGYVFTGVRPFQFQTLQPDQQNDGEVSREIVFEFDYMYVKSNLDVIESAKNKLKDTAKSLAGAGGKMLNI